MNSGDYPSISYKPCIDGLRALAVLAVVFYHYGIGFTGGYVGVDVFFVISGYLITLTIRKSQIDNRFSLKDFWLKRIRRVLPALVVIILTCLLLGYFILIPNEYVELAGSAIASMTLSANIYFWQIENYGYFSDLADLNPLLHIWSLAIEEQFYLLLPLVFVLSRKNDSGNVTKILIFTGAISFALSCWAVTYKPSANFFLMPTRAWELAVGCLVALHSYKLNLTKLVHEIIALMGIIFILLGMFFYTRSTQFPGWTAIPPVLGTCFFIYANHHEKTAIGTILSLPPIVFIGLISYSLYLWHWPVLALSKHIFIDPDLTIRSILMVAVLLVSVISWKYVEQPFLRSVVFSSRRRLIFLVMVGCLSAISLSWLIIRKNGFVERFTPIEQQLQADFLQRAYNDHGSFRPYSLGSEKSEQQPFFALWGDSHAACLMSVFDKHCQEKNIHGVAFVRGSSIPILGVFTDGERDLIDYNQRVMDHINNQSSIQHVILAARWSSYIDGRNAAELAIKPFQWEVGLMEPGDDSESLSLQRSTELLAKHLEIMANELNKRGITLWLIEQAPESNRIFAAREFYLHRKYPNLNPSYSQYTASMEEHLERQKNAKAAIARVPNHLIKVIDPTSSFFVGGNRLSVFGDRAYYRDDNHLTESGAMHYFDRLVGKIVGNIATDIESE